MRISGERMYAALSFVAIAAILLFSIQIEYEKHYIDNNLTDLLINAPFAVVLLSLPFCFSILTILSKGKERMGPALTMNLLLIGFASAEFFVSPILSGHATAYRLLFAMVCPIALLNVLLIVLMKFSPDLSRR